MAMVYLFRAALVAWCDHVEVDELLLKLIAGSASFVFDDVELGSNFLLGVAAASCC